MQTQMLIDEAVESLQSKIDDTAIIACSGGIDSSLITSLLSFQSSKKVKTYTIGFEEREFNEAKYSKEIAKYLDTDHNEFYFTSKDALNLIPELGRIYSEPFAET